MNVVLPDGDFQNRHKTSRLYGDVDYKMLSLRHAYFNDLSG